MSRLIETIQEVKNQQMEEIARKEAERRAKEDKEQQLELEEEKFMEGCYSKCQQILDESPCQALFQEANTEIFKGKGKIFKTKGVDCRIIRPGSSTPLGREEIYPSVKLVLECKRVKLAAVAMIHIDRRGQIEPPFLSIRCYSNPKSAFDFTSVSFREIESPDQPNTVIQEWKDEDEVVKAIAQVLVEKGVV